MYRISEAMGVFVCTYYSTCTFEGYVMSSSSLLLQHEQQQQEQHDEEEEEEGKQPENVDQEMMFPITKKIDL